MDFSIFSTKVCEKEVSDPDQIPIAFLGLLFGITRRTPFTQLLQTRVCFTNAGINTYGAEIHKVRKHAIYAFPSFLFLILLFRLYVKEPFSEIMERQNNRLV